MEGEGGVVWEKCIRMLEGYIYIYWELIYQMGMGREMIKYILSMMSFETLLFIEHEYYKMVHIISWRKLICTITPTLQTLP